MSDLSLGAFLKKAVESTLMGSKPESSFSAPPSPLDTSLVFTPPSGSSSAPVPTPLQDDSLLTANNIGVLSTKYSLQDSVDTTDPVDYHKFELTTSDAVSIFFNGLSAGYTLELLDSSGGVLQSSTNSGTTWTPTDSGTTAGSVTSVLNAGTYYARITPATVTGNPLYALPGSYTLNLQPHNAPNTISIAASNTVNAGIADYICTGSNDQDVINQAIAAIAAQGGGTVLLMEGTYSISDNVQVTYNNITLSGVGWNTILKLANNTRLEDAGLLRSAFHTDEENRATPYFSNQHFLHMSLDGNKSGGTSYTNSYGNFGTYVDSSFEDLRVHDFPHYGFDPHENSEAGQPTIRLTIKDSLADHNNVDGLTIDNCLDSLFFNNILDSNGRHGINIVTAATNNMVRNNVANNNGGNGIVIQPGGELSRTSDSNFLINNVVQSNRLSGILVQLAQNTQVSGNTVTGNAQHGIRLRGSSLSSVSNNIFDDNGQAAVDQYFGVYVDDFISGGSVVPSTNNTVQNNSIRSATTRYRNGIKERSRLDDFNIYANNIISGTVRAPFQIQGPNSQVIA
ncbi:MAG: hypothetical protein HC866_24195 [Leptolyngbyaceae cyanobacterium RU_5_1]|nr:hypothetical protein [Leptolyngbyaceae cyanobacterium RU_5_1]